MVYFSKESHRTAFGFKDKFVLCRCIMSCLNLTLRFLRKTDEYVIRQTNIKLQLTMTWDYMSAYICVAGHSGVLRITSRIRETRCWTSSILPSRRPYRGSSVTRPAVTASTAGVRGVRAGVEGHLGMPVGCPRVPRAFLVHAPLVRTEDMSPAHWGRLLMQTWLVIVKLSDTSDITTPLRVTVHIGNPRKSCGLRW